MQHQSLCPLPTSCHLLQRFHAKSPAVCRTATPPCSPAALSRPQLSPGWCYSLSPMPLSACSPSLLSFSQESRHYGATPTLSFPPASPVRTATSSVPAGARAVAALPGSEVLQDEAPWSFAHAHAPDPATCDVLEIVRPLDWALLVSAVVCGSSAALRWHPMRRFHRHAAFASCSHQRSLRRLHLRHTARRASHVLAGVARLR